MYRTISASFWTDPKVKQLSPDGRLLLLYFITNPHSHVSGIYVISSITILHETGLSKRALVSASDTLSELGFCSFDPAKELIWVKNMLSYQGRGEKNLRSAAHHVAEDLHNSFLCKEFIELYPAVIQYIPQRALDTLSRVGTPDPDTRILNPDTRDTDTQKSVRVPEPRKRYGEFQSVMLTDEEHAKLEMELNGNLVGLIDELDCYSQTHPNKFREYKSHVAVLRTWHRRRQQNANGQGKLYERESPEQAKVRRTREASARILAELSGPPGGHVSRGTTGLHEKDIPASTRNVSRIRDTHGDLPDDS